MQSLLKPVDLGLGILVGILCLHTPLILNQTTATTTKTKGSYWYRQLEEHGDFFSRHVVSLGCLSSKALGSGDLLDLR